VFRTKLPLILNTHYSPDENIYVKSTSNLCDLRKLRGCTFIHEVSMWIPRVLRFTWMKSTLNLYRIEYIVSTRSKIHVDSIYEIATWISRAVFVGLLNNRFVNFFCKSLNLLAFYIQYICGLKVLFLLPRYLS